MRSIFLISQFHALCFREDTQNVSKAKPGGNHASDLRASLLSLPQGTSPLIDGGVFDADWKVMQQEIAEAGILNEVEIEVSSQATALTFS